MSFRRGNIWRLVFGTYAVLWLTPLLQAQQLPRFTEQVQVTRILIDARVINDAGTPVLDLGSDDFEVKIGGKLAPIESVSWVSGHIGTPEDALKRSAVNDLAPLPQGRLIVFFIQKDMEQWVEEFTKMRNEKVFDDSVANAIANGEVELTINKNKTM